MAEDLESLLAAGAKARSERRLDDAFRAYQHAANQARDGGLEHQLIGALSGLGQIERDRGALDAASRHYVAALAVCRDYGHPLLVAHTARHLGDIYRENGMSDQAEPLLKESIALYRSSLDTKVLDLANALRPLALLHVSLGNNEAAGQLWRESRALYSAINVIDGVSECDAHLAAGGKS